ncbi:MAG: hypothetical protein RL065_317 [Bacteroidota bacterium]
MAAKSRLKVIIDTNIWISFLIGKKLKSMKDLILNDKVLLIYSNQLLLEIKLVTKREKIAKYFDKRKVDELIELLTVIGQIVEPTQEINICRDPKDNFLLSLATKAEADFIVTSDEDLLVLINYLDTKIINVKEFEKIVN